jgi:hypothetical protein
MKKAILLGVLLCTTCALGKKMVPPPTMSDLAGDWIGNSEIETFFLRLQGDASGKSVYILGNEEKGSISRITKWALNKYQIAITCVGVTYPKETYTIVGQVSPWVMHVEVRGNTEGDTWTRKIRLRRVKSVEREIAVGREAAAR